MLKNAILVAFIAAAVSSCATSSDYSTLKRDEYQIAGHPWKTTKDCKRKKPVGKFDPKCDIPTRGFRGFQDMIIVPSVGTGSGTGN